MSKIKEFVKWTDIALSLREMFDEVKESLSDHESEFIQLQQQNMLLLQQMEFQSKTIEDLKERLRRLEDRRDLILEEKYNKPTTPKELPFE